MKRIRAEKEMDAKEAKKEAEEYESRRDKKKGENDIRCDYSPELRMTKIIRIMTEKDEEDDRKKGEMGKGED